MLNKTHKACECTVLFKVFYSALNYLQIRSCPPAYTSLKYPRKHTLYPYHFDVSSGSNDRSLSLIVLADCGLIGGVSNITRENCLNQTFKAGISFPFLEKAEGHR